MSIASELAESLSRTISARWRELEVAGTVHREAGRWRPELPRVLGTTLERAIRLEREMGREDAANALFAHYTERMPAMLVDQVASVNAVGVELMHAKLRWERLPRMTAALAALFAVLERHGIEEPRRSEVLDGPAQSLAAFYAARAYGGCMPMLYAYPNDLAYFLSRGLAVDETLDRYLTAPLVHELCHFGGGILNLHLDECVAGWLGVRVWPQFAYPDPGEDDALYASPWLAQIGAALVRVFGVAAVLRAHAGFDGALPDEFVQAADRLYWRSWHDKRPLHLLADTMDPAPWLELITAGQVLAPDPAQDRRIVEDALRAMCLETTLVDGSFRTRSVVPTAPIVIEAGRVSTAPKTELDVVPPSYWIPATIEVSARREVMLGSLEEIPALAASLVP